MIFKGASRPLIVLIDEHVSGGGMVDVAGELPASWVAEGSAMRRALARDFAAVPDVLVDMSLDARLPDEPGPWTIRRWGPEHQPASLRVYHDAIVAVAPETGSILNRVVLTLKAIRKDALMSDPDAVALCGDKWALERSWRDPDLPTTASRLISARDPLPKSAPYPAILKPRDGAGCLHTWEVASPDLPIAWPDGVKSFLLQPKYPGEPMSASFLVDRSGRACLLAVGRQLLGWRDGNAISYMGGEIPFGPGLDSALLVRAMESVRGLRGFVGMDFHWQPDERHARMIEINPRVTTSFVGLQAALGPGALASAWLSAALDDDLGPARAVAERIARSRPIRFLADGSIAATGLAP